MAEDSISVWEPTITEFSIKLQTEQIPSFPCSSSVGMVDSKEGRFFFSATSALATIRVDNQFTQPCCCFPNSLIVLFSSFRASVQPVVLCFCDAFLSPIGIGCFGFFFTMRAWYWHKLLGLYHASVADANHFMSPYMYELGQCFFKMVRQKGSISQKTCSISGQTRSAARAKPPMPEKRSRWVMLFLKIASAAPSIRLVPLLVLPPHHLFLLKGLLAGVARPFYGGLFNRYFRHI